LLHGRSGGDRLLVLQVGTLGHLGGALGQGMGLGGNLGGRLVYLTHQGGEVFHHLVEHGGSLAHFVLALHFQTTGEVALAGGDVAQAVGQVFDGGGDEVADEEVDHRQQQQAGAECGSCDLEAEGLYFGIHLVEGNLHADQSKDGAFGGLVTHDAVLAQVVGGGQGGSDDAQVGGAVFFMDGTVGFATLHGSLLDAVHGAAFLGVGTEDLDDGIAADHVQVLDDGKLFDLVEEDLTLADGTGDHHAGESGHGHLMDAAGKVLGLTNGRFPIDFRLPHDHAGPYSDQHEPDGGSQTYPYF